MTKIYIYLQKFTFIHAFEFIHFDRSVFNDKNFLGSNKNKRKLFDIQ